MSFLIRLFVKFSFDSENGVVESSDKWGFIVHPIYYNLTLYPTTVGVRAL